ncbi:MAG: hypothetical protein GWP91_08285 [Rhodobacterales bacterium]|nr:hypothetical protein [Rhodobacterales bacterium]
MLNPWDHFRAALIVLHIVVLSVACLPPYAPNTKLGVLAPEQAWGLLMADAGLVQSGVEGADQLLAVWKGFATFRDTVVQPFRPYLRVAGIGQGWKMFGNSKNTSARLEIHGLDAGGAWQPLYVEQTTHQWHGRLLNHSRIRSQRSLFANKKFRRRYTDMVHWLAKDGLQDDRWSAIRIRYQGVRIPKIDRLEGALIATKIYWERVIAREDLP